MYIHISRDLRDFLSHTYISLEGLERLSSSHVHIPAINQSVPRELQLNNYLAMKRPTLDGGGAGVDSLDQSIALASYLILLSQGTRFQSPPHDDSSSSCSRVFECKTCNRQFQSFQALGGHRASHKKPRLGMTTGEKGGQTAENQSPPKPKTHECSICGSEFAIGQALGGHMRRHRANIYDPPPPPLSLSLATTVANSKPIIGSSKRRVLCLDLNLTPLENGLVEIGKAAAPICG